MTTRTRQRTTPRWARSFLAAIVAVLAIVGLAVTASSASAACTAETRVRAFSVAVEVPVGPPQQEAAGQRLGEEPDRVVLTVATGVAANAVPKALPSGLKIAAQWGADTYRHGGLMSTIEQINYRHAFNSGFSGVSKHAQGTPVRDLRDYVNYVLRNGTVTDRGMIGNVGRSIGTDVAGKPVSGLEIIVRDGMIKNAFPVAMP